LTCCDKSVNAEFATCRTRASPGSAPELQGPHAGGIAAGDVRRHLLAPGLLALELRPEAAALEQSQVRRRAIGGIGPHIAGRVAAIEHGADRRHASPRG